MNIFLTIFVQKFAIKVFYTRFVKVIDGRYTEFNLNKQFMSNLLAIETAFLNLPQVKNAINLNEIRNVQRTITNAKKKKFEQTLSLSKLVGNVVRWFDSEEGQTLCREEGIIWNKEQIGLKVFGWQKSFFYKVVKVSNLKEEVIETFKTKCTELESNGEEPNRSIEGLLKFAKQLENNTSESGQEDGTETETEVETRPTVIFNLTFKKDSGNVSVKISDRYEIKTTNSLEEIQEAINFLSSLINQ